VPWWSLFYVFHPENKTTVFYASVSYSLLLSVQILEDKRSFNVVSIHFRNLQMEEKFWNFVAVYLLIKRRKQYYQPYQGLRFAEIIYFFNT